MVAAAASGGGPAGFRTAGGTNRSRPDHEASARAMLEIRCACGKVLGVAEAQIGKALSCGSCKAHLRVVAPAFRLGPDDPSGVLVVRSGPHGRGEQIFLAGDLPIQIGKLPGSDIRLQGNSVSRSHCRLVRTESGWVLEDHASTNGIYVNAKRVSSGGLKHGDRIGIGEFRLKYLNPSDVAATAVPVSAEEAAAVATEPKKPAAPPPKKPAAAPPPPKKPAAPAKKKPTPKRPAEEPIYAVAEEVSDGEWAALAKGGEKVAPAAALEPEAEATAVADTAYHPHHDADHFVAEGRALAAEGRPRRGFWADVAWTFLLFTEPNSLVMLGVVFFLFALLPVLQFSLCIALIASFIVWGWVCSYWFKVILSAANGEDRLPSLSLTEGWLDDIIIPFFKFLGASLLAGIPAVAAGVLVGLVVVGANVQDALDDPFGPATAVFFAFIGVYALVCPIVLMVIAIGGIAAVVRVDLMVISVARAFLPYLAVCVLVGGTWFLYISAEQLASGVTGGQAWGLSVTSVVTALFKAYFGIVSMRIVGLYYHHFKKRFAWDWG